MPTLPWLQDVAFAFAMASHDRLGKDSTASAVAGDHDLVFSIMCYAFPADRWSLRARLEWVREQNMARYKHLFCPKMELFVDRMRPARAADQILECQSLHFAVPGNIDIATTVATGALSCRPSCACQAPRGSQSAEEQNSFVLVSSNTEEAPPRCESQGHGSEESRCWERLDGASWIAQSLAGDETASSNQDTPTAGTNDTACILGKLIGFSIINQIPLGIRLDIKLCKLLAGEVKRTVSLGEDNVADSNEVAELSPSCRENSSFDQESSLPSHTSFESSVADAVFDIIPSGTLSALSGLEIQQVVQGFPVIDIDSLRSSTHYFVFSDSEPIMEWFWRLLNSLNARARRFMLSWTLGYIDKQHYESARKAFEAELPQKLFAMGLQGRTSCCSGNDLSQLDWRTRSCNYEIFDSAPWVKRKKCRSFYGRKLLTPPFYIACQIFGNNLGRNATYCELLMPMFSNKDAVRKALMDLLPPEMLEENRSALFTC
uniref:HECT domain-containing protein n=1 Tax=Guillardia theta TaxID=55529 RepID=A0A7S4UC35_GUITH|mmetsp:Transcript_5131/g.18409  ORF Transcript_5131/g.18409 Transcript_5131/m.18409 type:complete len:489 (+) Transcript_5131:169-1635(+)